MRAFSIFVAVAACLGLCEPATAADTFPSKPISFIVPYAPGGANDTLARLLAQKISENIGQTVVVENKPGASGMIAGEFVANAPADGYTMMIDQSSITMNPALYKTVRFNVQKDLAPVTMPAKMTHLLVVSSTLPVHNIKELIALAKREPNKMNFSSPGTGSPQHIAMEAFDRAAGIQIVHVPYKGGAPAMQAVAAGEVQMTLVSVATSMPQLQAGRIRGIAMLGTERSAVLPDIPTFAELGFDGMVTPWLGIFAPAKTPAPIVDQLNGEFLRAIKDPQVREKMQQQAFEPIGTTPKQFASFLDSELKSNAALIRAIGIQPE